MGVAELIKALYDASLDDPTILGSLIAARASSLTGVLTKGGMNDLQNSQKNGVSFSVLVSLPETDRIVVLNRAINAIKASNRPSTVGKGVFQ